MKGLIFATMAFLTWPWVAYGSPTIHPVTALLGAAPYSGADSGFAMVQYNNQTYTSDATTATITNYSANNAGDLIVVIPENYSGSVSVTGVTDASGNTYRQAVVGTEFGESIWYAADVKSAAAAANPIQVTWGSAPGTDVDIGFIEYSGIAVASPLDNASSSSGSGTTVSSTVTTTNPYDLILQFNGISGGNCASQTAFNNTYLTSGSNCWGDINVSSAGTQTVTGTITLNTGTWTQILAAFKKSVPNYPSIVLHDSESAAGTATTELAYYMMNTQSAGDMYIVAVTWNSTTATISYITDDSDTFTQIPTDSPKKGTGVTEALYYATGISGAAAGARAMDIGFSASVNAQVEVFEYSGITTLDQHNSNTGTGTSASAGGVNTTSGSELIFTAIGDPGTTPGITAVSSGYRVLIEQNAGFSYGPTSPWDYPADRVVTKTGTYSNTFTFSGSKNWSAITATFH